MKAILLCLLPALFFSCANGVQEPEAAKPRIRTVLKSGGSGTVKAAVVVEGKDGNALSGAFVTITDEHHIVLALGYDFASGSYTGTMDEYDGDMRYTVEVSSSAFNEPIRVMVPYTNLSSAPHVTVFQDAQGNSVLNGQAVAAGEPVQIGWALCGEHTAYQLVIKTALKKIYTVSTNAGTITIPANTLPVGAYVLEITAQKMHGDMYFKTAPYYAVSTMTAPLLSCNVH
jgi:hypothetical protein